MDLMAVFGEKVVVHRTVSWQKVLAHAAECTEVCWSPDGRTLALGLTNGRIALYNLEDGMTVDEEQNLVEIVVDQTIHGLVWAHVGKPHPSWVLSLEEKQRTEEWR